MAEHFLADIVSGVERESPRPWYNPEGDCVVCQLETNTAIVAERVDELLTIYRSVETNDAVGFQIKGVHAIAAKFGWDAIAIEAQATGAEIKSVSIAALVLAAYEGGPTTISRRHGYAEAMGSCPSACEVPLDRRELCYA